MKRTNTARSSLAGTPQFGKPLRWDGMSPVLVVAERNSRNAADDRELSVHIHLA